MATAAPPPTVGPPAALAPRRSDRSPWNWLLLVPIVIPLIVPLYNAREPELWGWPLFYWLQVAFVALGVLTTSLVYRMTRRSPEERRAAREAIAQDAAARDAAARDREG
jgi:membrane protein implicated in regulation of membrane protease activity